MKTRDAVLLYQNSESDTKVETIDLNFVDPISAIDLEVSCVNGTTSNVGNFISDIVTKIEVVDGSDVLTALNLSQLEALQFYKTGKTPALSVSEFGSANQKSNTTLFFGRHLWDRSYALNPDSYTNPQLKVSFNKAAVRAASATEAFGTGDTIKLTVVAKLMEEFAAPKEFLMQKQVDSFTSVSSGDKRIDLARDYPYRMLMLRAFAQGSDIHEIIGNVKLSCDTDKYVPFDRKTDQIEQDVMNTFGVSRVKHGIYAKNSSTVRLLHNLEPDCRLFSYGDRAPKCFGICYQCSSNLFLRMYDLGTPLVVSDEENVNMVEEGHGIHATLPIVFGRYHEPDTWFNPKAYSKFELVLDQDAADGVCEIVAEQVRTQA
ncbi:hypothetical protein ES707_07559 [subsurface metagenome]